MEDCGFSVAKVTLLERYGRFREAAELYLAEGRIEDAVQLLMRDRANKESHDCLERCLLRGVHQQLSFGISLNSEGSPVRSLLQKLLSFADESSSGEYEFDPRTLDEVRTHFDVRPMAQ